MRQKLAHIWSGLANLIAFRPAASRAEGPRTRYDGDDEEDGFQVTAMKDPLPFPKQPRTTHPTPKRKPTNRWATPSWSITVTSA